MSQTITIAQRELSSMFRVPAGWIIIALFAFLTAVLFVTMTVIPGQPGTLRYFFAQSGWFLIPIAPAISMRLMSEEYRSGSFESLRTAPAGDWSVTLGKYLGSLGFLLLMLVPTLVYPILLAIVSSPSPDLGPIFAGYLMLVLVGMLYLGIGMVASSLTASQILAFLGTMMTLILIIMLTEVIATKVDPTFAGALQELSIMSRIQELSKGIIDTATIAFFVIGTVWMLVLASAVLEVRRLGRSRLTTAFTVGVFVVITGVCAVLAGSLTNAYHYRVDVTSTGAHKLSPRATRIVDRLSEPTEIVLAVGMSRGGTDTRAFDLVSDVLDAYARSSDQLSVRTIDLDDPNGHAQIETLLDELAQRDQSAIDANLAALNASAQMLLEMGPNLSAIARSLSAISAAIEPTTQMDANNRAVFDQRAALFARYANDIFTQGQQINDQMNELEYTDALLPFDTIQNASELTLAQLMNQLDDLSVQLSTFANADGLAEEPQAIARPIVGQLEALRDRAAIAHDRITRIERIDALRVKRALETGEALLVIGPADQGIAAIDLDELFPSAVALERAGISPAGVIGPRAQELIAAALAKLVAPAQPILVFVHGGQPDELLGASQLLTKTVDKLASKGIDTLEWAAIEQPTPPDLELLDPLGIRPIVFAIISPDSTRGTDDSGLSGSKRATEMGKVVDRLIREGQSLLVSLSPSVFPTSDIPDPIAQALAPMGIAPDAGRTLLHEKVAAIGKIADPLTVVVPDRAGADQHRITGAMSGLTTMLPWAIPMELKADEETTAFPIVSMPGDDQTWGESNWVQFKNTPAQTRAMAYNQPTFDAQSDTQIDSDERWIIAAGSERLAAGSQQRLVVVGSNGWFTDMMIATNEQLVDGRVVNRSPGNLTLLNSSIAWLAGMDDLIGPGSEAQSIATIKPMDARQLQLIRWFLLAGLPGLILILGIVSRIVFG